jgi:DNA sulfur modification protein DndC
MLFGSFGRGALKEASRLHTHFLQPELQHRFFVAVIGRGYAPPTHWFRWCTKGMRIRPMTQFIRKQLASSGRVIVVLGLRRSESSSRALTLDRYATDLQFQGNYGSLKGAVALTPIEDFGTADVWQFLMQNSSPWGQSNRELADMYRAAAGGECASHSLGEGLSSTCGGSRFGCWTCTVVRKDRSGEALAESHPQYEELVEFRNWLRVIRYESARRWKVRRNGRPGPGPLTLETRREILDRLLKTETAIGSNLIRPEEIVEIQRLWNLDGDRRQTALARYERQGKVTGIIEFA